MKFELNFITNRYYSSLKTLHFMRICTLLAKSPKRLSKARPSLMLLGTSSIIRYALHLCLQTFRLGDGEVAPQPRVFHTTYIYDQNNPFAIFKFKYRSLGTWNILSANICSLTKKNIRSSQSVLRNTPFAGPRVFG